MKFKDVKDVKDKLLNQIQEAGRLPEAYAYIPLFGWIYAKYFRKGDKLSQFHGHQSMWLNIILVFSFFVVWVLEKFPLTSIFFGSGSFFNPIIGTVWIIVLLTYLWASIYGAYKAYNGQTWEVPYLKSAIEWLKGFYHQVKNTNPPKPHK